MNDRWHWLSGEMNSESIFSVIMRSIEPCKIILSANMHVNDTTQYN